MPKGKTPKGILKRMKRTRRGKIMRRRANLGHLMSGKSARRRRSLRGKRPVSSTQVKTYTLLIQGH
jgi:large subunit ribosomal protein L35